MIYSVTRLFSKKEEYLNGKETDFQKNGRKHLTGTLAGLGTVAGASAGLITSKPKNTDRALKIADNAIKDNKKVLDFTEGIVNKLHEKGHQFISSFLGKISSPKDIKMTVDVDPLDIL